MFGNEYPEISKKMVAVKIANVLDSSARFGATGCPG